MGRTRPAVWLIIAINLTVFAAWRLVSPYFMIQNFTVSWDLVVNRARPWTLLTAEFSHESLIHFVINMMVLRSFGSIIGAVLGLRRFLLFYIFGATLASLGHIFVSDWVLSAPRLGAVGASGAISGLVMLFALLFPRERLLIFGLIPLPALFGALVFIALDLWGISAQLGGGGLPLGHGAHLGGALAGLIYYPFCRSRRLAS